MSFPSKEKIKSVLKELEKVEGTLAISTDASPLEKFRFDVCQKFLKYKIEKDITQKELAKILGVDEAKVSKILRYRVEEFSTDRLVDLYTKLNPNVVLKVG